MSLKNSTANKARWLACGFVLLAANGCAHRSVSSIAVTTLHGYADLDALVRHHPGWTGVAQYDLALARLQNASLRLSVPAGDARLVSLAAADAQVPQIAPATLRGEQERLETMKTAQVARLRQRRALSRQAQLSPLREAWQREADIDYTRAVQKAQGSYLHGLRLAAATHKGERLNLTLQINALQNTISGWAASPPSALRQTKDELAQKQALLAQLEMEQKQAGQAALTVRHQALAEALAIRTSYVETRMNQKDAALRTQDDAQIQAFAGRLMAQEQALLHGPSVPHDVPSAGPLGVQALPRVTPSAALLPGSVARSQAQLRLAEAQLKTQRARWVAFLYDDTRAAALDTAQQQHWEIQFAKAGAGQALTEPLAHLLRTRAWKT